MFKNCFECQNKNKKQFVCTSCSPHVPRILGPTFLVYVLKRSVILTSLALKNGVKNIQTAGYNGARTVDQVNQVNVSSGFKDLSIKKYSRYIPNVNDHFGQQVLS